jgi:BA14K-like protein
VAEVFRREREDQQMEFVMTGRSVLLASALMVGGVWAGSAGAAPIHADMALQGGAGFEQVQMRGREGGGGNRGGGMSVGRSGGGGGMNTGRSGGGGMSFNRSGGGGGSVNIGRSGGGTWSSNRAIRGGNVATNNRPGNWAGGGGNNWNGRRMADWRHHRRGFRGPVVAFGPSYYDYGYDSGYYPYDDESYAYVAPGAGVAEDDSVAYCQQRFRSYDPSTGTYLGYDGLRHPCP